RPPSIEALRGFEAVQLFEVRARAALPSFRVGPDNAAALTHLSQQLEGIPLAIELAAARASALSVEQIAARLDGYFRLLTHGSRTAPPRQQTLKATLDWSNALLSAPERALFARLAVFAVGFSLEAAEAVCSGDGIEAADVLDLLTRLVDKSLLLAEVPEAGAARFRLLAPIREYAWQLLVASGQAERLRERHAGYFLELTEQAEPRLFGPEQGVWIGRLEREDANLRAALEWLRERGQVEPGLRLGAALARFWWMRARFVEGRACLEGFLAHPGAVARTRTRARALHALALLIVGQGSPAGRDQAAARAAFEESLAIYRQLGDLPRVAGTLRDLGRAAMELGDAPAARQLLDESLALERQLGNRHGVGMTLKTLGWLTGLQGDCAAARAFLIEGLELCREAGDDPYTTGCLAMLAGVACDDGDCTTAYERLEEITTFPLLQLRWTVPLVLGFFARLAATQGRHAVALRILGTAAVLREEFGVTESPAFRDYFARHALEPARRAMSETVVAAAWEEGHATTVEQAVEYALRATHPASCEPARGPRSRAAPSGPLTPREQEVATLIARGLTDRQIAAELVITEGTASVHVHHILGKLDLRSRWQIADWAFAQGLAEPQSG
ncbi:MAG TPA: tetratricopeptide repeat protein, partial [Chloroflexota bacterium]|nr:tetratricopeptide repeat protein [Chloroflexota bacterium]